MGNSGFVMRGGWLIPVEIRTMKPHLGTHVHFEEFIQEGQERNYVDPILDIDWNSKI